MKINLKGRSVLLLLATAPLLLAPVAAPAHSAGHFLVPELWHVEHPGPHVVRVSVVVDPEWTQTFGASAKAEIVRIVEESGRLFAPGGVTLQISSVDGWNPAGGANTIRELYEEAETVPRGHADIVVALSAAYRGREGGYTEEHHRVVVIKHHVYRSDHDALVLAHEVGHVLGLDHHNCPMGYCIMSAHDFDERGRFCPDHLKLLQQNGGYFDYLAGH